MSDDDEIDAELLHDKIHEDPGVARVANGHVIECLKAANVALTRANTDLSGERLDLKLRIEELEKAQIPRPMGTAPRDGTWILMNHREWGWGERQWIERQWIDASDASSVAPDGEFIDGWLPLPPGPKTVRITVLPTDIEDEAVVDDMVKRAMQRSTPDPDSE